MRADGVSRRMSVAGLMALVSVAAACAPLRGQRPTGAAAPAVEPQVWPAPPGEPRIQFLQVVSQPQDLGIQTTFWHRLVDRLVGAEERGGFVRPTGVAADAERLYVADPGLQVLWRFDLLAKRSRQIRTAGRERLVSPVAVALAPHGGVYLADSYLAKVFLFDGKGQLVHTIATRELQRPAGLAYDALRDRLYVADSAAHRVLVVAGDGSPRGAIGRRGASPGEFNFPTHVALGPEGVLYVTDALGFRVQRFTAEGAFTGEFGRHGDASGDFASPKGVAVDSDGHVYVVDALFDTVQIFDQAGRLLLNFGQRGAGRGEFSLPNGLFIDGQDRIYVADAYNHRIQLFAYLQEGSR